MKALPTGLVTFLFTDIEGSTRLVQALGEGYEKAYEQAKRCIEQKRLPAKAVGAGPRREDEPGRGGNFAQIKYRKV